MVAILQEYYQNLDDKVEIKLHGAATGDETRDLMIDEFRLVGPNEAIAIAEAIVGPDSANVNKLAIRVFEMMKQTRLWSNARHHELYSHK